ncbi:MAG: translocation/assembly module TamB domain-containing protein [Bacteroidota bacterium]
MTRKILRVVLILVALLLVLFQLPFFQNWLAQQVTSALETTLETDVSVERVRLSWLDKLDIDGLYVQDKYGDTLLFTEGIDANLSLWRFFIGEGFSVESLSLSGSRFKIQRHLGDPESNLQYALARLFPPKEEPGRPFDLDLRRVDLEDILFAQLDSVRGQSLSAYLEEGVVRFRNMDLPNQTIEVSSAELRDPIVQQISFAATPLDSLGEQAIPIPITDTSRVEPVKKLKLLADNLEIINGEYKLTNYRKDTTETGDIPTIDFARLHVLDVDLELTELDLHSDSLGGRLKHLSLEEKSGFVLDHLGSQDLLVTPTRLQFYELDLNTANSQIGDSIAFDFPKGWSSWDDFDNQVRMDIRLKESRISIRDLLYFARNLRNNPYFRENRNRQLTLNGRVFDRVNRLRGEDVSLKLDNANFLRGTFRSRNLSDDQPTALDLELDQLVTDMGSLQRIFSNFQPPPNFEKLGKLRFSGRFQGFLNDFLANGALNTDVGRAELNDMAMTLPKDLNQATYRGEINLIDFDLGTWANNPELGLVNFYGRVSNGRSIRAATAEAEINATIQSLEFKKYTYANAQIAGQLNRNFFNGDFSISDENINLNFTGELDFRDSIAKFDFAAQINRIDLQALNLSPANLVLSGLADINLINTRFTEAEGRVLVRDLELIKDDTLQFEIDSILAYSEFDPDGRKVAVLQSDIAEGKVTGQFDINQLVPSLKSFLRANYPEFSDRLNINAPRVLVNENQFDFDIEVKDSKGLQYLINPNIGILKDIKATGTYESKGELLLLDLNAPQFQFDKIDVRGLVIWIDSEGKFSRLQIGLDSAMIDKTRLADIEFRSLVENDSIIFDLIYDRKEVFDPQLPSQFAVEGLFYLPDSLNFGLQLDGGNLVLFNDNWQIQSNNRIIFGKDYFSADDFNLKSGRRRARIRPSGTKGLKLQLEQFELSMIDSLWDYDQLDFSGNFGAEVIIKDVFRQEGITANMRADSFLINGDDFGWMRLDVNLANLKDQLIAYLSINKETSQLTAEASYNLGDLNPDTQLAEDLKDYLNLEVNLTDYPLEIAEYWVGGSVSEIDGSVDATLNVEGPRQKPEVTGTLLSRNGTFKVDYLNTTYRFDSSRIAIDNKLFDLAGTQLIDRFGNTARLYGGVTHDRLKNLGLDAHLVTDRFLSLDLGPGDNDLFYGQALGSGRIDFTGDFKQPDIYARARVGSGSSLYIPVDYGSTSGPIDNVIFIDSPLQLEGSEKSQGVQAPRGVSLEMDLIVTEEAEVEIIFDEEVGDKIRGRGRGDLRIEIPRGENMRMFGRYNIERGNYLFTFYQIINKEFSVRPGGSIIWTGDPLQAEIDLEADYEDLQTPIYNFIQEYLLASGAESQDLVSDAANATEVDLTLILKGELQKPDINFDLDFPDLTGRLQTFAENKRRLLLLDQTELNRQVFGLIVVGQFLPADLSFSGTDVAVNTLSEWLSSYFSLLLNDFFTNTFGEESFLSDLELDIAYERFRSADFSQGDVVGNALEFTFSKDLSNRWTLSGDINFLTNNQLTSGNNGTFVGNDVVLEYVLNDARTLKWRLYQRRQPDIAGGRRLQFGTGFSWRREFNSLSEFFGGKKKESD